MASLPSGRSGAPEKTSAVFLSLVSVSLLELRGDLSRLMKLDWAEPLRRRAEELASTLEEACKRQGLEELAKPCRSIANLTRLSREEVAPLRPALREKFEELLGHAQRWIARHVKRHTG